MLDQPQAGQKWPKNSIWYSTKIVIQWHKWKRPKCTASTRIGRRNTDLHHFPRPGIVDLISSHKKNKISPNNKCPWEPTLIAQIIIWSTLQWTKEKEEKSTKTLETTKIDETRSEELSKKASVAQKKVWAAWWSGFGSIFNFANSPGLCKFFL